MDRKAAYACMFSSVGAAGGVLGEVKIKGALLEDLPNIIFKGAKRNYSYWSVLYADMLGPIGCL